MQKKLIWEKTDCDSILRIKKADLLGLGITEDEIKSGEKRGVLETCGPWQIPVSYRALVIETTWTPKEVSRYAGETDRIVVHGFRTMRPCSQSGYYLEGWISLDGKKRKAFTCAQMFEIIEDGDLMFIATINPYTRRTK